MEKEIKIKVDVTPTQEELIAIIKPLIPEVKDGKDGIDGKTPTPEEILKLIKPLIPKVKDGKTPTKKELLAIIKPLIPKPLKGEKGDKGDKGDAGKDGILITAEEVKAKIIEVGINYTEIIEAPKVEEIVKKTSLASKTYSLSELDDVNLDGVTKTDGKYVLGSGGSGGVQSVEAGTNITVDNTDPANPIVSATGGSGAVDSVNGQTGVVVLDTDDIADTATNRYTNDTDIARLANTSGTNTGDQDLSTYLQSGDNVSELVNDAGYTTNTGTVTSVAVSGSDGLEVDSGSPVTTSGTIALGVNKTALLTHINVEDGAEVNNISDANATDLTDGGDTTLHIHDSRYYTESETDTLLNAKVTANASITGATKTKITYDSKGLVTAGADAGISDITGLQTALDNKVDDSEKGANNGVATLDAGGKVPASQLPSTVMEFQGTWNASTNSPTLADGTGDNGDVYTVSVAGTQNLGSGAITFALGDWVIYNGTIWEKSDNSDDVVSVNGQQGVVVLDADDISDSGTTNKFATSAEKTKLSFISVTQAVDLDTMESNIATNNAKVTNATHTGDIAGATSTTAQPAIITGKPAATVASGDLVLIADVNDTNALKQVTAQSIADLGGGGVSDGDKGDITVSGTGATWTVDNNAITYAKIQDVSATDRILGRDTAGAGDVEELTVSGGLEFTGTGIRRSALTGEVTASAGSNSTVLNVTAITSKLGVTIPTTSDQMLIETGGVLKKITLTNLFSIFGQVPIGGVIDWAGTTLPTGYLYVDGSVISRTTYADLFAVIGTTYGAGDGSTTFALPDARGRVTAGMDNMNNVAGTGGGDAGRLTSASKAGIDGDTLGASGGEEQITLTHQESGVPAHAHAYVDRYRGTVTRQNGGSNTGSATLTSGGYSTSDNTPQNASEAHNNVQPTLVLNKIIRFGL